ncbi:hypothetical protein HK098_007818 [Nowakowskiella sp. JEL0407]|nr:hypothetical protein HK098_007818 [Nowakowskiella sp. JEL0407]
MAPAAYHLTDFFLMEGIYNDEIEDISTNYDTSSLEYSDFTNYPSNQSEFADQSASSDFQIVPQPIYSSALGNPFVDLSLYADNYNLYFPGYSPSINFGMLDPATSVSICVPLFVYDISDGNIQSKKTEVVRKVSDEAMQLFETSIVVNLPEQRVKNGYHEFRYSVNIFGSYTKVLKSIGHLMRNNPSETMISLRASRLALFKDNNELRLYTKKRLEQIKISTKTQINCQADLTTQGHPSIGMTDDDTVVDIEVIGQRDGVEKARILSLVLCDHLAGLHVEHLDIDFRFHYIIAGRKKVILDRIMHETMTNIYLPRPFLTQAPPYRQDAEPGFNCNLIYISGDFDGVQQAKERILSIYKEATSTYSTRQITCLPRKLDLLFTTFRDKLNKLMYDNATCILIPPIGSNDNLLNIMGTNRVYIERTARALMILICDFYIATIQIDPNTLRVAPQHLYQIFDQIALESQADIFFQSHQIEISGLRDAVKLCYRRIVDLDVVKPSIRDTFFQVELAHEHREFINGKKNGKINKITKTSNCKVQFEDKFNDFNMLINIHNPIPIKALEGLALLEDELPGEISFFVPEAYHKRIIGVGGKNIQRIMKKYGVYVKFSNAEEFNALGGYYENDHNVIARTPAKNANNLEQLKQSIFELVNFKLDIHDIIQIPRLHHRVVIGPQASHLFEIRNATKIEPTFPERESGSDVVSLEGPELQVQQALSMLHDFVPKVVDVQVPVSATVVSLIFSSEIRIPLQQRLIREFNITLYVSNAITDESPLDVKIFLHFSRNNPSVEFARQLVFESLNLNPIQKSVSYPNMQPPSNDPFQHFNSKLLSVTSGGDAPQKTSHQYSLFGPPGSGSGFMPKNAQSVPNLRNKALFEELTAPNPNPEVVSTIPRSRSEINEDNRRLQNVSQQSFIGPTLAATHFELPYPDWSTPGLKYSLGRTMSTSASMYNQQGNRTMMNMSENQQQSFIMSDDQLNRSQSLGRYEQQRFRTTSESTFLDGQSPHRNPSQLRMNPSFTNPPENAENPTSPDIFEQIQHFRNLNMESQQDETQSNQYFNPS